MVFRDKLSVYSVFSVVKNRSKFFPENRNGPDPFDWEGAVLYKNFALGYVLPGVPTLG